MSNNEPGDRGFLHDVRYYDDTVSVVRVEEEDGNEGDREVIVATAYANTIPDYDPLDRDDSRYFETDPDLPEWLADWARPIIDASRDTDEYRQHAAEWLGTDSQEG